MLSNKLLKCLDESSMVLDLYARCSFENRNIIG